MDLEESAESELNLLLRFLLQRPAVSIPLIFLPPCIHHSRPRLPLHLAGTAVCYIKAGDSVVVCRLAIDRRLSPAAR